MTVTERNPTPSNRLGIDGLEFIEFTTSQPLVLGALLDKMGFRPVARHRSREVLLYRQGSMNLVVNAHPGVVRAGDAGQPVTAVGAMAFRVADAGEAHRQTVELGAWDLPTRAAAMELLIPGIRGAGDSHIYFVDRHRKLLDLRRGLHPDRRRRSASAGAGGPALLRGRADGLRRTDGGVAGVLPVAVRLHRAARAARSSAW